MGVCSSKVETSPTVQQTTVRPTGQTARRNTKTTQKSSTAKQSSRKPHSSRLDEGIVQDEKLPPKEAARLAAERRLKENDDELRKGELGKKLAQQRHKNYRR
ncbi:hypothetical protein KAFR_0A04460 [Kazachstania africana CBS 2517]|uniref:Uncharacterized protein n=1 Tax=Kazachstania africana (strain ATCC 22294 / BCRC 22015 / CBS 2517 / CECT 1963 / NBRC 1671 / NRRL Y-8276) TaxID=1071382 RepID=H2AND1_KAZAF|nr:hypothetical protein KAFR_0A04460 [Kazachstania africana CBS 2517]CCF55881.1 hypothetical protein KAFR_0A04460 [Kazachstania africana CBS 2517]